MRRPDDADIWTMSFPKARHIRALRHARKGLVSCLRLETTEVLPGAVAVSSDGIQLCRSCLFHVKAQKYAAGSAERPLRVHEQGAPGAWIARDTPLLIAETEDHTAVAFEVNPRKGATP